MLKIAKNLEQKFEQTVNVKNLGTDDSSEIKVIFKYNKNINEQITNTELFKIIVVGWTGIVDEESNAPIPFNNENLELLSNYIPLVSATVGKYIETVSGARVGN